MCFRPAEADAGLGPIQCPKCGKRVNRAQGVLPSKCPFCKEPIEDPALSMPAPAAPSAPIAPGAPGAPAAPKVPPAPPMPPRA